MYTALHIQMLLSSGVFTFIFMSSKIHCYVKNYIIMCIYIWKTIKHTFYSGHKKLIVLKWKSFPSGWRTDTVQTNRNIEIFGTDGYSVEGNIWIWYEWSEMGRDMIWVMSVIMIWAFYRAAAGMIDFPSVCIIKGQSSHSHNNHCGNICLCVCVCVFLSVGVKASSCRRCYAKICCLHSYIT